MPYTLEVNYFNSFWLKKTVRGFSSGTTANNWPALPWNPRYINQAGVTATYPVFPFGGGSQAAGVQNWYVEEARVKGGFNNSIVSLGVRAYAVNDNRDMTDRSNSLIFSGVFNSRTGFNETNEFSVAQPIVKDADPINGSIQKLYTEDTNLIVFQENKVSKALISKSTVYSGEQGAEEALGVPKIIGQLVPYLGEYGISKNPESFAIFGYRKYFADKNRAAILRLSRDGITEISAYGMRDYFRDYLATLSSSWRKNSVTKGLTPLPHPTGVQPTFQVTSADCCDIEMGANIELYAGFPRTSFAASTNSIVTNIVDAGAICVITVDPPIDFGVAGGPFTGVGFVTYSKDKAIGGFDIHNQNYVLSMQTAPRTVSAASDTFATLSFDEAINGWNSFYSYKPVFIDSLKNKFYSFIDSNIYEHYYDNPPLYNTRCKFYGATTPDDASIIFIFNPNPSITKNFNTIAYEGGNGWEVDYFRSDFEGIDPDVPFGAPLTYSDSNEYRDTTSAVTSYNEGKYIENGITYYAGFNRKENKYVANIISSSTARPGEVIFGNVVSGIKGYVADVKFSTDATTDPGGMKELFSVSSNFVLSSR